jgi:hypothetical protein
MARSLESIRAPEKNNLINKWLCDDKEPYTYLSAQG